LLGKQVIVNVHKSINDRNGIQWLFIDMEMRSDRVLNKEIPVNEIFRIIDIMYWEIRKNVSYTPDGIKINYFTFCLKKKK
jgi:hypothetical protein